MPAGVPAGDVSQASAESGTKRLGQILIEEGEITRAHLEEALRIQEEKGGFLGQILVDLSYVKQETVVSCLVKQCKIPHLSLLDYEIGKEILQLVPQELCLKYSLLPIDKLGRILTVAMVNPLDTAALEELRRLYPELRIKPILCDWQHFKTVMARNFGQAQEQQQEAVFDIASFGPGVKGKKTLKPEPAPAEPAQAEAPVAPAPDPDDPSVIAALDQAISAVISNAAPAPEEMTIIAPAPKAVPAGIPAAFDGPQMSAHDVTAMMRDSIAGIMQETMASLVVSAKTSPGNDMAPQQLAEMVRDGVAAAMQETLATLAVQMQSMAATQQPAPQPDGVSTALQETLSNLTVQVQALAQQRPAENLAGAMRETLAGLTEQIQAAAQQARPSESLTGTALQHLSDLTEQVHALVQQRPAAEDLASVVHHTLADLSVQMQALAQQRPATENIAMAVRDGVAAALQGGLTPSLSPQDIATAIKEALKPGQSQPSTLVMGPEMAEALKTGIREALRENESAAVARANRLELEARDAERTRRTKHASVSPFALTRRHVYESMDNPELRAEGDQRVVSAMHSDRLLPEYTFDGFYPGTSNEFTFKLCQSVAARPGSEFNPFFLYGEVGLGKTHLVNAIGNEVTGVHPDARVGYVSASRFATRLLEAIRDCALDVFRENYCHWDVLILDDIQFLGGRVEAQEEFFHIFNVLQQEQRQIVIVGDKPPDRLGLLEQRLVSRFSGGIVCSIRPAEWETRVEILRHHADERNVKLPEELLSLIAMRVPSDNRKMIGALRKVTAYAELVGEAVSCEMANEILNHLGAVEAA